MDREWLTECTDIRLPCLEDHGSIQCQYRFGTIVMGPQEKVGVRFALPGDERAAGVIQGDTSVIRLCGVSLVVAGEAMVRGDEVTAGNGGYAYRARPGDGIFGIIIDDGSERRGDIVRILIGFDGIKASKNILRSCVTALRTAVTYREVETALTAAAIVLARDPEQITEAMDKWRVK